MPKTRKPYPQEVSRAACRVGPGRSHAVLPGADVEVVLVLHLGVRLEPLLLAWVVLLPVVDGDLALLVVVSRDADDLRRAVEDAV